MIRTKIPCIPAFHRATVTSFGTFRFAMASCLLLSTATACASRELVIIDGGRTTYEIIVREPSFPTTHLAARELQHFLTQSTGVELKIVPAPTRGMNQILIAHAKGLAPHGLSIETVGTQIWLRGRDSAGESTRVDFLDPIHRGTCNAVYEFLGRFVGVRWFWGDELGDIIPRHDRLTVPSNTSIRKEPFFDYRALAYGPVGSTRGDWARRNRLGAAMTMHHSHHLHKIIPTGEWAARGRPDFAAMINGKRKVAVPGKSGGKHVCTSNADLITLVAQAAMNLFERRPDRMMFSISPADGSGMCQGPICRALDVPGYKVPRGVRKGRPVLTDRIIHFYNAVADQTAARYPDRFLGGYIYADYLYPPRRETSVRDNVALVVAPNVADDILNDQTWAFAKSIYGFWGRFHDRVYAYDTMYQPRHSYGLPAPLGKRAVDLIRFIADSRINGCYLYIAPTWEASGPTAYLAARLLWDSTIDIAQVEDEYYRLLYKDAAVAVRAYYDVARSCLKRASTSDARAVERLSKDFHRTKAYARDSLSKLLIGYGPGLKDLEKQLVRAERLAARDPIVRRRVARLRDNLTLTAATCVGLQAVVDYERAGRNNPTLLAPLGIAITTRDALLTRVGKTYAAALEKALRGADKGVTSPLEPGGYYHKIVPRVAHSKAPRRP
jgi:Domain of unknown function (DUF4838)